MLLVLLLFSFSDKILLTLHRLSSGRSSYQCLLCSRHYRCIPPHLAHFWHGRIMVRSQPNKKLNPVSMSWVIWDYRHVIPSTKDCSLHFVLPGVHYLCHSSSRQCIFSYFYTGAVTSHMVSLAFMKVFLYKHNLKTSFSIWVWELESPVLPSCCCYSGFQYTYWNEHITCLSYLNFGDVLHF
jgi:hypothetical protein